MTSHRQLAWCVALLGLALGGSMLAANDAARWAPKDTPMCNLLAAMSELMEVPAEKFGDSTGLMTGPG